MKDLLAYHSYHTFLEDLVAERKSQKDWFSLRWFAQQIGMDQGNLVKVFQGQRHISPAVVDRLVEYLELDPRRADYLRELVAFGKARTEAKSREHFDRMMSIAEPAQITLEPQQYEYYRHWFHSAVYALLDCVDFRGDFVALAKMIDPPITPVQAKASIDLLLQLELIRKQSDGRYVQTHQSLTSGESWRSMAVHAFQKGTLQLALHSLESHPRDVRDFSTLTMSLSHKDLDKVRDLIRQFRESVVKVVQESEPADRVYQMNLQLFPMAQSTPRRV